jgi:hypothetical protein
MFIISEKGKPKSYNFAGPAREAPRPKPKVYVQKCYNYTFIAKFYFVPNPIYLQYPQTIIPLIHVSFDV